MTLRGSALKKLSRRFPTRGFGARCDWRWPRDCPRRAKRSSEPSARLRLVVALNDLDQVAGALALGLEVVRVVRIGVGAGGNPPMDRDALVYQTGDLERVVRHQIHGQNAQHPQHLRGDVVPAQVVWKAELAVGLVGIHPLGLQRIGLDLVAQADATALLTQVQDNPALALGHHLHRPFKLLPAIALQAAEDFSGETLRMDPHRNRFSAFDLADHQSDVFGAIAPVAKNDRVEYPARGGQIRLGIADQEAARLLRGYYFWSAIFGHLLLNSRTYVESSSVLGQWGLDAKVGTPLPTIFGFLIPSSSGDAVRPRHRRPPG